MPPVSSALRSAFASVATVFVLLLAYSAVQAPVPAVNEPQYLGKAKHFWDPAWCPGDFFLDSSNPHLVFYAAVGWLTRFLSLEATAWVARVVGYALLATGWTMLARRVAGSRWAAVPSAALFLLFASLGSFRGSTNPVLAALSSFGSLSGEWLVGGIEGKVLAYAFLFAAIALRLDDRRSAAAACLGAAVSFHPVVGAWGLLCGLAAELISRPNWGRAGANVSTHFTSPEKHGRNFARRRLLPAALVFVTALPGLVPAALTLGGSTSREAARATFMQVFIRLRHHLDPTHFPPERYFGYAIFIAGYLVLRRVLSSPSGEGSEVKGHCGTPIAEAAPRSPDSPNRLVRHEASDHLRNDRWFTAFVLAAVVVALPGVAVGWHGEDPWTTPLRDLRGTLLKFYPFRLADVFVPLALSLAVVRGLVKQGRGLQPAGRSLVAASLLSLAAFTLALAIPSPDRNPSRMSSGRLADWIDAARWVRENTPPDALIVSPSRQWGFRWFAGRAVYVDYKDAPQDTPGLLEWERRLEVLKHWLESPDGRYSAADLRRLGDLTDGIFFVTDISSRGFDPTPLYDNGTYRVYALRP